MGTSKDAFPFAYKDKNGRLTGYSIDMSILIHKQVEKELKRPIKLNLVPIDPNERIPKLRSGAVDIVCDAASFTWERERKVELKSVKELPPPLLSKTERDSFPSFRSSVKRSLSSKRRYQHIVNPNPMIWLNWWLRLNTITVRFVARTAIADSFCVVTMPMK